MLHLNPVLPRPVRPKYIHFKLKNDSYQCIEINNSVP